MSERALPGRDVALPSVIRTRREASANDVHARDAYVERALAAMEADPARRWTVAALARAAGLSRAPFARRFRRATGTAPLRWLAGHRAALAGERLAEGELALAAIAAEIGYGSEFAFSKAFKRVVGVAPAVYRRRARASFGLGAVPVVLGVAAVFRAAA